MTGVEPRLAFGRINRVALANAEAVLRSWLPKGRTEGREYMATNPRRADRRSGSFKINLDTGKWGDFAVGARGGDLVSLAAYLAGIGQGQAAREPAAMLGIDPHE